MSNPLSPIIRFNKERNLTEFNAKAEYTMLAEELEEFGDASAYNDEFEQINALCDLIVVATGALWKLGYNPSKALDETTKEILARKGTINSYTGKWEKDKTQDPATLYKPDYISAKRWDT